MRRTLLATTLGVVMAALLLPTVALAGSAPSATTGTVAPATETTPVIDLSCRLDLAVMTTAKPHVVCTWNAFAGAPVRAYRIWRSVDGHPRQWVGRVTPDQPLRFVDRTIVGGHAYHYRIAVIGTDGARLGVSDLATVRYQRAPEKLAFNCLYIIDGSISGARCHWAASTRPAAVRYVLFRSVDGAARQVVYRTRLNGVRTYLDKSVSAGQSVKYAVVAFASDGRVVGIGGPDVVVVPTPAPATAVAQ